MERNTGVDMGEQVLQVLATHLNEMEGRLRMDIQTQINEVRSMAVGVQGQVPIAQRTEVQRETTGTVTGNTSLTPLTS